MYLAGKKNIARPSDDSKDGESEATEGRLTFVVDRYDFTIQMAWIPRSPAERFERRMEREKKEAELAAAAEAANEAAEDK